jgi:hypothetical protein
MRKLKVMAIIALVAILSFSLSGCLSLEQRASCEFGQGKPPGESSEAGAVVIFQPTTDFPDAQSAISQSEEIRKALPSLDSDVPFFYSMIAADGSPSVAFQAWINLELGDIQLDLLQKNSTAQAAMGNVYSCSFDQGASLGVLQENVDLVGALSLASRSLANVKGKKSVFVFSNGFQTSGLPNFNSDFPSDFVSVDKILSTLVEGKALPDLTGIDVSWIGIGQVTSRQEPLSQQAQNVLEYFWTQLIGKSGGKAPKVYGTGALGNEAPVGATANLPLAEIDQLCLFQLGEIDGFSFKGNSSEFVSLSLARSGAERIAKEVTDSGCAGSSFKVTGFVASGVSKAEYDSSGPNMTLAKNRAQAFADLLLALGIQVSDVAAGGKGPFADWKPNGEFDENLGKRNRIVKVEDTF